MRTMTATEASRAFAALLDEAEWGETIVVTRGGRRIATIGPAPAANGSAVLDLLREAADDGFADDVDAVRDVITAEAPAWSDD